MTTNPVRHYDDTVRQSDCEILTSRHVDENLALAQGPMRRALYVFLLDPTLRAVLEILDPKAVEQARKALEL